MLKNFVFSITVSFWALCSGLVNADIIDFQVGPAGSCYSNECPNVQGFDFSMNGAGWGISNDGNTVVNYNSSEGIATAFGVAALSGGGPFITMVRSGGGAFSLSSLDAAVGALGFGSSIMEITGVTSANNIVNQFVTVSSDWDSFLTTGFTNLTRLVFHTTNADAGFSIDNLAVELESASVPISSTLTLFLLGLFGVRLFKRPLMV